MLQGKLFRSCLRSDGATHLVCIGALKKLCNHPSLIFSKASQAEECPDDIEEVIVLSFACLFIQNLIIILLCTAYCANYFSIWFSWAYMYMYMLHVPCYIYIRKFVQVSKLTFYRWILQDCWLIHHVKNLWASHMLHVWILQINPIFCFNHSRVQCTVVCLPSFHQTTKKRSTLLSMLGN